MTAREERLIQGKRKYKNKGAKLNMAHGDDMTARLARILIGRNYETYLISITKPKKFNSSFFFHNIYLIPILYQTL